MREGKRTLSIWDSSSFTFHLISENEHELLKRICISICLLLKHLKYIAYLRIHLYLASYKETKTKNTWQYYNTAKSFEKLPDTVSEQMHTNAALGWPITHMSSNYISVQGQLEGKLDPVDIQLSKQDWERIEDVCCFEKKNTSKLT